MLLMPPSQGQYLIRIEQIALHIASNFGDAQVRSVLVTSYISHCIPVVLHWMRPS